MSSELVLLLAEDDDGHAALISRRLRRMRIARELRRFTDGADILDFLIPPQGSQATPGQERFCANTRYALLLDINLPKVDGIEVLRRVRAEAALKDLVVIMLTTTDDPSDMETCRRLGCDEYVVKPIGAQRFADAVVAIGELLSVGKVER